MAESWGENDKVVSSGDWGANDPEVKPKGPGAIRKAGDLAVGLVGGAVGATKALTDVAGAGNVASNFLDSANKDIDSLLSPQAQADKQEQAAIMKEAEGKGTYEGVKAGLKAFAVAPVQTTMSGLGSVIPVAAATMATGGGAIPAMAARAATGAAMGAGTVKGAIYDDIKERSLAAGMTPEAAEAEATKAQSYGGGNTDQIALGAGLGMLDAATGVTPIVANMARKAVGRKAVQALTTNTGHGILRRTATGVLEEMPLEAAQGGQEQLATNLAAQRAGYRAGTWDNVASNATLEGLASAGPGAGFGALSGGQKPATQPPAPQEPPPAPQTEPGAPQLGYNPMAGTHTVFPDGSIVLNSESSNGAKTVRDMQRENRLANAADPFFGDPAPVKPSEAMGLAPTAGPSLANAAILSVDTGIHQAAAEEADPYNAPLSALGQELSKTNQRLREEADALGLDTEGLHGDAARMTDGKPHEDYLTAANDQLRKAMKAAKEIPDEGQRGNSDDPAPGGEAKGPDAQAGKAPAGDAAGPVGAGAVRPSVDRVGEHGQRPAGTDGGSLPGAVAAPTRDQAIAKATDAAGKVLASGGTDADANRAATDSLIDQMAATPGIAIAQDAPAAVKAAKAKPPANNNAETTTSAPAAPAAGLPAAGPAPIQAAGVDQPDANKAKWLKAINDQNRLAGETGIQLKVVDGKLTFMGDPRSSKQGQALSATLDEARKAGATIPEIIASIQNPKGTPANVPQPAQPGTQASQAPSAQGTAPAGTAVAPTIDNAAHQAATSPNNALPQPTDGQKKAGNYAKGHVNLNGLDLSIENPAGSTRSGTDKDGKAWSNTLKHHYGYIKGTVGNDKDHVDLFVKPETPLDYSGTVFVIDQHHPHNGRFDEHKVMVGFANEAQAKKAYHANYAKGWKGMKSITPMTFDAFKAWVKDGAKNTPVSKDPSVSTQPQGATREPQADQAQQAEAQRPQEQPAAAGPVAGAPLPNATAPEHVSAADKAPATVPAAAANPKIKAALDKKNDLDAQLAALNDELDRQGAVKNANTRAQRDAIRKQIAEQDFPEILKAVDDNIDVAEELNRAFKYAGDEPKAKTIERILKKRGITPEYQKRWSDRLMEGQQAGTKPESVVKVPEAIGTAIQEQMEKQKRRVMRRRSEESAPGLNLEQKAAAQTKTKAAEATLRAMRTSIFDAEDAAVKAIETGKASEFEKHADLFPAANDAIRAMLGQNDELDAEMQANEAGLTAQTRADDVKKLVDAAPAAETKPATVVVPPAIEAALDADMQAQKARITRLRNAATADGMSLDEKKQAQTQLKGAEFTLQTMRRTRFDAEDAAIKAIEQNDMAPFAEHITFFKTEKALQEMIGAAQAPAAKPVPKKKPSADRTRAKADLMAALADLGDILGKNTRMNIMPEQEQKLLPVLTRLLDAAFRLGYHKFKDAAKFALDQIRAHLGDEAADALTLDHMQGAYIAMAGGKEGADTKRAVIDVESKAEIEEHEAKTADEAQDDATADPDAQTLTESLYQAIGAGNMPKDNPALKKLVEAFDGKPADPARMKQAQEELETAIAMSARDIVAKGQNDKATFDELLRLYESQPSLNIRTSTSVANQAYSTPAPLAFIASRLAGITRNTVAHEPTGGTGMLLIGADPKKALVNELNDLRISALKAQGFAPTQLDAATMRLVPDGVQPDAVVTNPPFGSIKDADGKPVKVKVDGYNIGQIDHLIAARALQSMKDDGKATLILGANKVAGGLSTDDRIFFNWLYSHYNVVGHFEVEGDLYARQGAGWPVRVITINGRQKSSKFAPVAGTIQRADNWSQVYEQFTQSLGAAAKPATGEVGGGPAVAIEAPGAPGGRRPQGSTGSAGNVAGTSPRVVPDRAKPAAEPVAPVPDEQRLNAQSFVPQPQPGQNLAGAERPAKPAGNASLASPVEATGNEFQVPYVPRSARKDDGVLIPSNMAQPTQDALNRLEDAVGDIDEFARKELGYESTEALHNALMGLQVDSVATAIYQIKQGKAAVIADQTGIGKGRQAASIIRWAARNGMTPVFVSVKPSLFTDMYGDLADIGTHDVAPFILNSAEWVSGADGEKLFANKPSTHRAAIQSIVDNAALPQGRNALFMTYSQINTANLQRQALMALAPNAVFVLDESHNAAGDSGTGEFMISVLKEARGVTYLSATYAKRPDNMPLYFKTDIGDAAADSEGLADAMAAGGLPLQTVVSNNLVKAGQMFRRERSYDGVSIASTFDTANRQLHERLSDEATEALRAIVSADKLFHSVFVKSMDKALKANGSKVQDNAGNQVSAGVQHTEFSSVVHNFVRQMLLGLKAQTAADEAIASLKRGEKPIIAVENTMGSFLSEYAAQNNINQGDSLGAFDYRTVLSRALERSRVINVVLPTGDKSKQNIPLSQLDPITRKAYDQAQAVIDSLAIDIPVSPIDWMRAEIARAGFSVAEITGRDLAVDYSNPRKPVLSAIDLTEQRDKVASTRRFNGGELDALILNVAGSTGISLHASEKFADQRQRHMIVAQAAGDINIFMQMLGRVHRTGQVRLPKYTILSVDLPTEKRPTAVLSRKMKSLNANTSSNTESATSVKTADILNKYGDQIVNQYLVDNLELARQLGVDDLLSLDGERVADDIARKATGRLALQPIEVQRAFYEDVEAQYDALIEYLNKTNQNDLEPRTFDYDAKEVRTEILFDGPNKATPFGEDAVYGEYSIKAQGVAMKPEEIRAVMTENLGGLDGAGHANKLVNDLLQTYADQFNANRAKNGLVPGNFDEAKYTAYMKGIYGETEAAWWVQEAKKSIAAGIPVSDLTPQQLATSQSSTAGIDFIRSHAIGKTFRVEINSEPYNAVVTNVRSTHKTTGNPFSLSKIQLTLAVNGALRSITVPATQFRKIEVSSIAPAFRIETLFKEQPANQRETAKIVTGNLLAAYGEIKGVRGTIISFTKADGVIEQGILLPKLFDFSKNTQGDYRLRSGADALKFLQQSTNKDIGRFGIATRDGQVRVLPRGDGVQVRVPKSKAQGARYFLDKNLIAVAGDFVSSANAMVANVEDAASAEKVLDMLMDKQALYALPSMADEAKSMAAKPGADGGVASFSRAPAAAPSRADSNARNVATQMLVDGLKAKWTRAPEIIVARNMQDAQIPQAVRDYDLELKSQGATGEARGFIYKGKVYLLSDELKGPQQIAEVLFHEVLGHYGLRGVFGDSLNSILQQMGTMRRRDVVAKAREYGLFDKDALGGLDKATASDSQIWAAMSAKDRLSAAEEVLAEMAQTTPEIGFVKRAVAAIRTWLRTHVPWFKNLALTDAEIIRSYILPARGFVQRGQQANAQKAGLPGFARGAKYAHEENQRFTRQWYDRLVDLLPESYRSDPYRREPLSSEDRDVLLSAKVQVDALNKELRGPNDRKGYGPITLDKLGNLQVDARESLILDITGKIKDLADRLDLGLVVTGVNRHIAAKFHEEGFESEISLAAIADRLTGVREPISDEKSVYAVQALGAILSYKPRGFPMALFSRTKSEGTPVFSRTKSGPFYSELSRQIEAANINAAPGFGWKATIKGLMAKGVKADEITWSGIEEWLDLQTGKVTKAQVLDYLAANGVQVEEVTLGQPDEADIEALLNDEVGEGMTRDEAIEYLSKDEGATPTKYQQYTLPGGKNYREVLLTLPDGGAETVQDQKQRLKEKYGVDSWFDLTDAQKEDLRISDEKANRPREKYKSSHWSQPNVLAHIRVNDRVDADGKRVLFVEEIQSDWGQQGKKDGFFAPSKVEIKKVSVVKNPYNDGFMYQAVVDGKELGLHPSEGAARVEAEGAKKQDSGVPNAPFVTHTDKWLALALKRIVKMAVDGGYDRVAFVNGEQSADRYDLSKQIKTIYVTRSTPNGDFEISAVGTDGGQVVSGKRAKTISEVEDIIGKEMAQKVADMQPGDFERKFSGLDLKVGGEGMRAFYDTIVPNTLKALLKKVGGGRVEMVNVGTGINTDDTEIRWTEDSDGIQTVEWDGGERKFDTEDEARAFRDNLIAARSEQPGFTITPAMREKAAGGLPLFTRQNGSIPASFGAQYGNTQPADPQALAAVDSLNDALRRYFGSNDYGVVLQPGRDGGVSRAVEEAIRVAFGKRVVPVAAAPGNRDVFNGFQIPSRPNDVFVNVNARVGFVNIAGHELWHSIERQRPDLIAWYREQSRGFYKDLPAYRDRLNALLQAGERQYTDKTALSELEADFLGDSLTDRDFLQSLADASPSKFKALLTHVGEWLNKVLGKLKGLGSAKEVTDVQALRGYLKNVLVAFAEGKDIPQAPAGVAQGVSFNRANDERAMADAAAIAAATDPFWEKERISAIRREFNDEYSNDGTVDGRQIDTETGVERDEDGDVTPAGDEEIWRRAQAAIDAATSKRAGILSDLDDIDAGGTHMQAYHAAQAWLDAMGVAYQEIRSAGSRYLEIHSADYVEGKETESANKSLKLRFASHQNQSRSHTSTDLNWVEGGQDAALSDMLDAALRFSQGEVGLGEKVNFSRAHSARQFSPTARAQAVKAVEYTASTIRSAWANAPEVIVAFDMGDPVVPASARRADEKQRSGGAKGAPEGFYYKGKVYLMASRLMTPQDAARVLFHEALGHHGLRGAFGKDLDNVLRQIATMRRAQVDAKVKEYGLRGVSNLDLLTAAEEVLAEMAQTTPQAGFVKRAVAAIRQWLREHGVNLKLTDNDIIVNYILPARGWVERGQKAGGVFGGLSYSMGKADQTLTANFKRWFAGSKVVDADGKPLVVYHGTEGEIRKFEPYWKQLERDARPHELQGNGSIAQLYKLAKQEPEMHFFAAEQSTAESYGPDVIEAYLRVENLVGSPDMDRDQALRLMIEEDADGAIFSDTTSSGRFGGVAYVVRKSNQIKSATGNNGDYDPGNDDINFSRATTARDLTQKATEAVRVFTNTPGKVNWWHKTVGTQYNLAQRSPEFKRVYDAVQDFIGDVSFYATEAADLAPQILPKLDTWRDIAKSPLSADDTKAIAAPIFEGTLVWARDEAGQPVKIKQLEDEAALMSSDRKAQRLLRNDKISEGVLKMWRGLPMEQYEALINGKYEKEMLKAGVVWSDAELRSQFSLSDVQIALYREFRAATDKSLTNLAISDMLYFGGKDVAPIKSAVLEAKTVTEAAEMLRSYLMSLASDELSTGVDMAAVGEAKSLNDQADALEAGAGGRSSKAVRALEAEISAKSDLAVSRGKAGDMPGADKIMAEVAKLEKKLESAKRAANGYEFIKAKELRAKAKEITDTVFASVPEPSKRHVSLIASANKMIDKGDRAADLMARGYAPLSRFGTYTLDVVDAGGERVYFGLFESRFEADRMAKQIATEYPGSTVEQGTLSEESYKLFAGVSPETVALFGDMLGLEDNGAYQDYLKLAKSTRSAMKRLIERKGIAGFSEDAGRVLAGFVYSNARQTSQNMHTGEMVQAANDIPKGMGELKDKATQLVEYIKHPVEEAQKVRGLLFAQYIGGSVASAMVNMTQPFTMTMPWLSQFGGLSKAAKQMSAAVKDATRKTTGNPALDAALKRGEEDGTVSPQEVHDLMRQAQGKGALKSGDGTKLGNATAAAQNAVSRIAFAWGKLFSTAEQFNRRVTFIAAYRTAVEQGMSNPDSFARRAIHETQGVYNKGNKPDWARGAVGSTLFTFKQYSIAYVEMLHRMATTGVPGSPERAAGRRGALYALAVLMLLSGVGGLPGADDLDDIISGLMQSLGYNFDSKAKRKAFLAEYLGDGAAQFMERGVSGLAGVPIDISGRMGLGNLIPATGLLTKKADHTSDVAELLGPAGDMAKRAFQAGGKLIDGDVLGNHGAIATAAPKAVQNLFQAADMADKGMYRDQTGKKVMETGPGDALAKALGFQPNDVKRQQDATWEVKRMVDLNRITETEIADRWAIGLFEKDMEKVQGARDDLAKWNADNPESPIRIKFPQILQRVRAMNQTKAERIAKTAPKELKAQVREVLSQQ